MIEGTEKFMRDALCAEYEKHVYKLQRQIKYLKKTYNTDHPEFETLIHQRDNLITWYAEASKIVTSYFTSTKK